MTNEKYDTLVCKLEERARSNPKRYQSRVLLLAVLGNAYFAFILIVVIGMLVALVAAVILLKAIAIKFVIVLSVFLWIILKAFWVTIPAPEGTQVSAKKSPELFAMIDELRAALDAPNLDYVLITNDFNAAVVKVPTLGILGRHQNYLLLGLPLMKALGVMQFKAVLAHEFGHLAKGHGYASNWIYGQRTRWNRLMQALEERNSAGTFLFKPFLNWFAPYFSAYSFPLARANEYEADATSARLTSPRIAAEALTTVVVAANYLGDSYWPKIFSQADEFPRPSLVPYSEMREGFVTGLDEKSVDAWLKLELARNTTSEDTHPALRDRLQALGEPARLAPPAINKAADTLLGNSLEVITNIFDRRWQEAVLPSWQERYQTVQEERRKLAQLNEQHETETGLSVSEACERAWLTESAGNNPEAALKQFQTLFQAHAHDVVICFNLGSRLLKRDDVTGYALLEHAMHLDESCTPACCEALSDYCSRNSREDDAQRWHEKMVEQIHLHSAASQERNQVLPNDKFERHDLPVDAIALLRVQLQAIEGLRSAYFVKKRVKHLQHRPCYVLAYTVSGMFERHRQQRSADVLSVIRMTITFQGETLIMNVEGSNSRFGRRFYWMKGARIL